MSISSGIDRESLDIVEGAFFSGEFIKKVRLVIYPTRNKLGDIIRYYIARSYSSTAPALRNGKLTLNITYY